MVNYVEDADNRNRAEAESVASGSKDAIVLQCNVGDAAQVDAMLDQVRQRMGGLDILVEQRRHPPRPHTEEDHAAGLGGRASRQT